MEKLCFTPWHTLTISAFPSSWSPIKLKLLTKSFKFFSGLSGRELGQSVFLNICALEKCAGERSRGGVPEGTVPSQLPKVPPPPPPPPPQVASFPRFLKTRTRMQRPHGQPHRLKLYVLLRGMTRISCCGDQTIISACCHQTKVNSKWHSWQNTAIRWNCAQAH